ncbi:glycoside hydrolase family 2 TIM barrel-domain containing protein [Candidatus Omnitrophota bacterium]
MYKRKVKNSNLKTKTQNAKFSVLRFGYALCVLSFALLTCFAFAQEGLSSKEYVAKAWEVLGQKNWEELFDLTNKCIEEYKDEADTQQASLSECPPKGAEGVHQELNDVATCYFIQGEAYMRQGKNEKAKKIFQHIIDNYKFAQAWDPRGWFWLVEEKARVTIDKLEGKVAKPEVKPRITRKATRLVLNNPGTERIVNYKKYGTFKNIGTKDYQYEVINQAGLIEAVGDGIYPNTSGVRKDPEYKKAQKEGRLEGNHWDYMYTDDLAANFYKWAMSNEPPGTKLFYTALALERAGLIEQAIKAYYTIIVHFPGSTGWTYWHTPWYPGQAAIAKVRFLVRKYPELELRFEGARIKITNGFDNDITNDIVIANPGVLRKINFFDRLKDRFFPKGISFFSQEEIKKVIGDGKVQLVQYKNNHWRVMIEGKPFVIKGITYAPTRVGQSPDEGTLANWMVEDSDNNGKIDGPYDVWVDKNRSGRQDADEPVVGDFQLLKEMGTNVIRLYKQPHEIKKEVLRDLYENYGIYTMIGDFLGKYALGSGAGWYEGTDYTNPEHKKNMLESVRQMVMRHKDEPYTLMWLLGNENNYGVACNADKNPEAYFKFVNEAALLIKSLDKDHPVAVVNGDTLFLDIFAKYCPDVDAFGANAYRGDYGFGSFWEQVNDAAGIPGFITEYGCPAHVDGKTPEEGEQAQADYHKGCWDDIAYNMFGGKGEGNAIGGVIYQWLDEWWKAYEPSMHDTAGLFSGPFPDGYMHEEWLGICGQGHGASSPFLRELRKSYFVYQALWR